MANAFVFIFRRAISRASSWISKNDGTTIYKLNVKDVPVDGFWSISLYNAEGYFEPNNLDAYTLNNITAKRAADDSVVIQFGGCDGKIPNCLPKKRKSTSNCPLGSGLIGRDLALTIRVRI